MLAEKTDKTTENILNCQVPFNEDYINSVVVRTGQKNRKDAITFAVRFFMEETKPDKVQK